jgi:hypothetical protein
LCHPKTRGFSFVPCYMPPKHLLGSAIPALCSTTSKPIYFLSNSTWLSSIVLFHVESELNSNSLLHYVRPTIGITPCRRAKICRSFRINFTYICYLHFRLLWWLTEGSHTCVGVTLCGS